jgi:hypothetical protein
MHDDVVPDILQQSASTQCDGTQIAANTADCCAPTQVLLLLAHTSPRSRSRCSAEDGKPTAMMAVHRAPEEPELTACPIYFVQL